MIEKLFLKELYYSTDLEKLHIHIRSCLENVVKGWVGNLQRSHSNDNTYCVECLNYCPCKYTDCLSKEYSFGCYGFKMFKALSGCKK